MRILLQRVSQASVEVGGQTVGQISRGMLLFVGIRRGDSTRDADYLADKVINLRVFPDEAGKMNLSLPEVGGSVLIISQFTLYGDCRKGRRPGFDEAAPPEEAKNLFEYFLAKLREKNLIVQTGIFQSQMQVHLTNDGPVTFILESNQNK